MRSFRQPVFKAGENLLSAVYTNFQLTVWFNLELNLKFLEADALSAIGSESHNDVHVFLQRC